MRYITLLFIACTLTACSAQKSKSVKAKSLRQTEGLEKAVVAGGCFWCVEAIYQSVDGVGEVISGYAGGSKENATYAKVGAGLTKHAEAVEIYYNPAVISYETILEIFFGSHDPTTLNRQGPDSGTQYRSAIFYKNEKELEIAKKYIAQLEANNTFKGSITTTLEKLDTFYPAEDYHQDYEELNPNNPYVQGVSIPRLKRFQSKFPHLLKKSK